VKIFIFFLSFLALACGVCRASSCELSKSSFSHTYSFENGKVLNYEKPRFWKDLARGPKDWSDFMKDSFTRENAPWLAGIAGSTLLLIKYDREIYEETRRFGKRMNISTEDKTKTFIKLNGVSLFRGPTDLGSAMYFLGDGWISIGLFGSFKLYGLAKDDWRASSTANQLMEGLLVTGFTTQILKWSTGRQMPKTSSGDSTGRWHPFATDYLSKRRWYDAFPSGHLATGMMCVTVLTENYPEKKYIKPVGYSLLALLSFQMVNNGVHWVSDYPLGLAVGYGIGKSVASRHVVEKGEKEARSVSFYPYLAGDTAGGALVYRF